MSYNESNGCCLSKLISLLILALIVGLGASAYYISLPQDLSDIKGASPSLTSPTSQPRDLHAVLTKAIHGNYSVHISETELNLWLTRELKLKQAGELAPWVTLKRAYVRLGEGVAEVIIERDIAGYPLTTSMFLQVEQSETDSGISTQIHLHGGAFHEMMPALTRGGRFGQLPVPQGFLLMVMPDFKKMAELFGPEIDLGFKRMARIKIEKNRLTLDPKAPTRSQRAGDPSF